MVTIRILIIILYICFVGCVGGIISEANFKNSLVQDGYAEYYLDEGNCRQWRMIPLIEVDNNKGSQ